MMGGVGRPRSGGCSLAGGEEVSLLSGGLEPVEELFEGNLAVAIFVELLEGLVEGVIVEFLVAADLAVELVRDRLDLIALEEAGAVLVEGSEKFLNNLLEVLNG